MTCLGGRKETEHVSRNNGPLWWSILVKRQVHDEQKPVVSLSIFAVYELTHVLL